MQARRGTEPFAGEEARLLACIHCGFCLDACPTYTRLGLESDSPRGRLYLMRAVAEGRVAPDAPAFALHMDRCLGCRACEPVCPSGVEYGHLYERARAVVAQARGSDLTGRALRLAFGRPGLSRLVGAAGRALAGTGLAGLLVRVLPPRLARARFALAMLDATRPWRALRRAGNDPGATAPRAPGSEPPPAPRRRPLVALLRGCVQRSFFARVNDATGRALRANGCDIVDAPAQRCCGALHAHGGDLEGARRLARANIRAFEATGADFVVTNAAGCGAMLKEYVDLFDGAGDRERAAAFVSKVKDAAELLVRLGPRPGAPVALRAAYDSPCHLIHAQGLGLAPLDLLRAVPGLEVAVVPRHEECCGGAGTYGLTHAALAGRILADKLDAVRSAAAEIVLTPNPGCIMQIGAGLRLAGDPMPVLHPLELLDESYRRLGPAALAVPNPA